MKSESRRKIILRLCSICLVIVTYLVFRTDLPKTPVIFLYNIIIITSLHGLGVYRGWWFFLASVLLVFLLSLGQDLSYLWNTLVFFLTFLIVKGEIKKQTYAINLLQVRIERLKKDTDSALNEYRSHKKKLEAYEANKKI